MEGHSYKEVPKSRFYAVGTLNGYGLVNPCFCGRANGATARGDGFHQ